jgi:hypothetical protein
VTEIIHENDDFEDGGDRCFDIRMCRFFFPRLVRARQPVAVGQQGAQARVYIRSGYAARAVYYGSEGLPWNAVRAYYFGGPWSTAGGYGWTSYTGWPDYAARNGIGCTPGTAIKGGDGIMYNCQ